jgi:hypothetical protein
VYVCGADRKSKELWLMYECVRTGGHACATETQASISSFRVAAKTSIDTTTCVCWLRVRTHSRSNRCTSSVLSNMSKVC